MKVRKWPLVAHPNMFGMTLLSTILNECFHPKVGRRLTSASTTMYVCALSCHQILTQ